MSNFERAWRKLTLGASLMIIGAFCCGRISYWFVLVIVAGLSVQAGWVDEWIEEYKEEV